MKSSIKLVAIASLSTIAMIAQPVSAQSKPLETVGEESTRITGGFDLTTRKFDGKLITESLVERITGNKWKELLVWSDCNNALDSAKNSGVEIVTPSANGCLYLMMADSGFNPPQATQNFREYWLLDAPCEGKLKDGCYLGYTIDTRTKNSTKVWIEDRHYKSETSQQFWKGRAPDKFQRTGKGTLGSNRSQMNRTDLDVSLGAIKTVRIDASESRHFTSGGITTEIKLFDPRGEQIGETMGSFLIAQSQGGTRNCAAEGAAFGQSAQNMTQSAQHVAGEMGFYSGLAVGGVAGAVGGGIAGAGSAGSTASPPVAAAGGVGGAVTGAVTGGLALGSLEERIAETEVGLLGGAVGIVGSMVVEAACNYEQNNPQQAGSTPVYADEYVPAEGPTQTPGGSVSDEDDEDDDDEEAEGTEDEGGEEIFNTGKALKDQMTPNF